MVEKGTLRPQRFLTAVGFESPHHLEGVSRELWKRIWSRVSELNVLRHHFFPNFYFCYCAKQGEDIVANESLLLAAKAAAMDSADIEKCIKMIDDSVVKSSLKKATEDALEYGVCIKFL